MWNVTLNISECLSFIGSFIASLWCFYDVIISVWANHTTREPEKCRSSHLSVWLLWEYTILTQLWHNVLPRPGPVCLWDIRVQHSSLLMGCWWRGRSLNYFIFLYIKSPVLKVILLQREVFWIFSLQYCFYHEHSVFR